MGKLALLHFQGQEISAYNQRCGSLLLRPELLIGLAQSNHAEYLEGIRCEYCGLGGTKGGYSWSRRVLSPRTLLSSEAVDASAF